MATGDAGRAADLAHKFHRQINLAADSRRLALLLDSSVKQLPSRFYARIEGHVEAAADHHRRILAAFGQRDPDQARAVMEEHLLEGAERLIETLEQLGVFQAV